MLLPVLNANPNIPPNRLSQLSIIKKYPFQISIETYSNKQSNTTPKDDQQNGCKCLD